MPPSTPADPPAARRWPLAWRAAAAAALLLAGLPVSVAQDNFDDAPVLQAREAARRGDAGRLLALRQQLVQAGHPLASWADYWELSARLPQASVDEVERFYQRWSGSYVEDRLRNDWLLELGRRRDWAAFARDLPRFRMNDDRELRCYAWLLEAQGGRDVRQPALAAWLAQRDADDGCHRLATELRDSGQFGATELWLRLRQATDTGRQRAARQAAQLLGPTVAQQLDALWENPERALRRIGTIERALQGPIAVLAVMRIAAQDAPQAAAQLEAPWAHQLRPEWAAAAWGAVARQASLRLLPEAVDWGERALDHAARAPHELRLGDDTLAWIARAQLRQAAARAEAWSRVATTIDTMSETARADPTWSYWKARALLARARPGSAGDAALAEAQDLLRRIASPLHFYGQLALEQLGQGLVLPPPAGRSAAADHDRSLANPGLQRALRLIAIGLRSEGVREWNFTLLGMDDRELLAAAQVACDRQLWDRCIATSERTRQAIDLVQRYPPAFADDIAAAAGRTGLDPALVMGLIRQESRFVIQARSPVGASGLMQVMPTTARWTARRIGVELRPDWREDRSLNLALGTGYLRMVLDDFGGSLPMALAAYNAGPNRPRRWREGPVLEPAIWAEAIPIHETRDYVKKVLSNAAVYSRLHGNRPAPSLKSLLGPAIGPREPDAPAPNKELP